MPSPNLLNNLQPPFFEKHLSHVSLLRESFTKDQEDSLDHSSFSAIELGMKLQRKGVWGRRRRCGSADNLLLSMRGPFLDVSRGVLIF